jgi:alpha-mannosidase
MFARSSAVLLAGALGSLPLGAAEPPPLPPVFSVSNFHPASCGWLTNWSTERNYCANSYLDHLDHVAADPNYTFVLSEVNNMIAIRDFTPERFEEVKQRVKEGRVELVNAFFLEPTVSLSGGEALAKMGIEGLRWQEQVMGAKPRFCWAIDTCGVHAQMPQLCKLLGLEGFVFTRMNPTDKAIFWSESPDGSRIPSFAPGHYSDGGGSGMGMVYLADGPLKPEQLTKLETYLAKLLPGIPKGAPILRFAGRGGDYALGPLWDKNPGNFLEQWKHFRPDVPITFGTFANYFDTLDLNKLEIPVARGGTAYSWNAFWVQNPKVKQWYRRSEHALQAAETAATIASLKTPMPYPAQDLYHAWLLMLLNMDRNTLWGAAGGMVFEHPTSWDVKDRFEWVEAKTNEITGQSVREWAGRSVRTAWFNPLSWDRNDPVAGTRVAALPATGIGAEPDELKSVEIPLPETIDTRFYTARVDAATGAIVSLRTKPEGKELLGGPANVLIAEEGAIRKGSQAGDELELRDRRPRLGSSSDAKGSLRVTENAIAVTVEVSAPFYGGGKARRVTRFNKDYPRIDFETELNDLPDKTVVAAEFPLAETPVEIRRAIPFGFAHGAWDKPDPNLPSPMQGVFPAIRWSDYTLPGGGGIAILDRGIPGREITGKTPLLLLTSTVEKYYGYPNAWLAGKGRHHFSYALAVRNGPWDASRIPQMAWEFNCPPIAVPECAPTASGPVLKTSDNLIAEVMRCDGPNIEIRLVECLGRAGTGRVTLNLPHESAALTDLVGGSVRKLEGTTSYEFPVKPQEIVTLRCRTSQPAPAVTPLLKWDPLVPEAKRAALNTYQKEVIGHPPRGN